MIVSLTLAPALLFAAAAQEPAGAPPQVAQCRLVEDDRDRLRCYDTAFDTLYPLTEEVVEKREAAREEYFGKKEDSVMGEADEITATIAAIVFDRANGAARITLDNGQVWATTSNGTLAGRLREGQSVRIYKSSFSGYRLKIDGRSGMQGVRRVG